MPGFLTPDSPPDNQWYVRRIVLPADKTWTAVFDGLLLDLTRPWSWTKHGDLTPDETAEWFNTRYDDFIKNFSEAPEYDTPENVDGEPIQPWYEQLSDWIIAGFLAITFTPQAALVYETTVPRIRVALRTGNLGALFKVLINGVEVWTGDSYGPLVDIIEQVFDNPTPGQAATVRVVHNGQSENVIGTAKLEYVRNGAVAEMVATILRADPTGCGIQWSTDNGENWETVDLAECITTLANDAITQALEDGKIAAPGNSAPVDTPAPGECKTFLAQLSANSAWVCPMPVSAGDVINVTDARGTWNDGAAGAVGPWRCPDGVASFFGVCFTATITEETDPMPELNHMRLIGNVNETWFDGLAQYVVPEGVSNAQLVFQANDSEISDNLGNITFKVEVCNGASLDWYHEFDLTAAIPEWTVEHGLWQSGQGVLLQNDSAGEIAAIRHAALQSSHVTYCRVRGTFEPGNSNPYNAIDLATDNYAHYIGAKTMAEMTSPFDYTFVGDAVINTNFKWQMMSCYVCPSGTGAMTFIAIGGIGDDPFDQ